MKKTFSLIVLCLIVCTIKSQEIINISPDQSVQGENIDFTISGQNAHFVQASNTTVWFSQGSSTIIYPNYITVNNENSLNTNFSFSLKDPIGPYHVNVNNTLDGMLTLENGFTLNAYSTDTFLISVYPSQAPQEEYIGFTISGYNTNFSQGSNTVWFTQGSNTVYPVYTVAEHDNMLYSNFIFSESDPTGLYDLYVQNLTDGTLILSNEFTLLPPVQYPEIVSVSPNEADKGDIIELSISGESTHFSQASNTVWFTQGSNTVIYPNNTDVINDTKLTAEFSFFNTYESGYYDIHISNYFDNYLYLEDGFFLSDNPNPPQLLSNSPDKSPRNESITLSISGQNTNFNQASNLIWLNQEDHIIYAKDYIVSSDILLQADFDFGVTDSIDSYNLNVFNHFDGNLFLEKSFTLSYGTFISDNESENILIFPNPTNGHFRIDHIPSHHCTIDLITMDGKIIRSYSNNSDNYIDISLTNFHGYYFIRIRSNTVHLTRKILILNEN